MDEPQTTIHVRRAVDGDRTSLGWVVARLAPLLVAQAEYRLGPALREKYEAEDLVDDAWLVALPRLADLEARDGRYTPVLLKFLSTTLLYRISNLLQKRIVGGAPQAESEDTDPLANVPADVTGIVTAAVRREARASVREHLDELKPMDREIIVLRGIEQHPNQVVAEMLGLTKQATSLRYRRALERLRERLPESVFGEIEE